MLQANTAWAKSTQGTNKNVDINNGKVATTVTAVGKEGVHINKALFFTFRYQQDNVCLYATRVLKVG